MNGQALFELDKPIRERVAAEIMPAAFSDAHNASWKPDAARRALELADRILAIVEAAT